MAAALESGLFTPDTVYDCPYFYTEISGVTLQDWTWQRCEDEKLQTGRDTCTGTSSQPSGELTLVEGLMRSCDPWFYHIGYTLYNAGLTTAVSDMSRGFGLAELTGIGQVEEEPGRIPLPTDGLNATSLAIGQGDMVVTPLQVANFIAAIANGGTLYRPQLVEKILPAVGDPIQEFKPEALGTLPIKEETLAAIQEGMLAGDEKQARHRLCPPGQLCHPNRRQDRHSGKRNSGPAGMVFRLQPVGQSR